MQEITIAKSDGTVTTYRFNTHDIISMMDDYHEKKLDRQFEERLDRSAEERRQENVRGNEAGSGRTATNRLEEQCQ